MYSWVRANQRVRVNTKGADTVLALKGGEGWDRPAIGLPSIVDINLAGKRVRGGAAVRVVGTFSLKSVFYEDPWKLGTKSGKASDPPGTPDRDENNTRIRARERRPTSAPPTTTPPDILPNMPKIRRRPPPPRGPKRPDRGRQSGSRASPAPQPAPPIQTMRSDASNERETDTRTARPAGRDGDTGMAAVRQQAGRPLEARVPRLRSNNAAHRRRDSRLPATP